MDYFNSNNINSRLLLDTIIDIRNKYPAYSKYKIHTILKRDYNINNNNNTNNINSNSNIVSISTIGRI